ncbi:cysteine hydrolase family protein [Paenibacillus sp. EC2-1]|uniref:cysteine hydrolase family protein n=1 Tax=Paenibacillus sp. EC2-1 TaxID=3388665 RepID=UPI003BEF0118
MSSYTEPNFEKCAVITIDTQNDFSLPGAVAEIKGTYEVIPHMESILKACRVQKIPIVHVIRIYREDGTNVDLCRRSLIESGARIVCPQSSGAELVRSIMPLHAENLNFEALLNGEMQCIAEEEWVMYKSRWGAFYKTDLEHFLKEKDIDTLVFIGCNFPNCPRTSMYEASERDFKVVMVEDAVSGVYPKGIEEIQNIGVNVYSTKEFIDALTVSIP